MSELDPHADDPTAEKPVLFGWTRAELLTLLLAVAVVGVWALATAIFGFAGLITVALVFVAAVFVALVWISRG